MDLSTSLRRESKTPSFAFPNIEKGVSRTLVVGGLRRFGGGINAQPDQNKKNAETEQAPSAPQYIHEVVDRAVDAAAAAGNNRAAGGGARAAAGANFAVGRFTFASDSSGGIFCGGAHLLEAALELFDGVTEVGARHGSVHLTCTQGMAHRSELAKEKGEAQHRSRSSELQSSSTNHDFI
jgi:hypothetical protein